MLQAKETEILVQGKCFPHFIYFGTMSVNRRKQSATNTSLFMMSTKVYQVATTTSYVVVHLYTYCKVICVWEGHCSAIYIWNIGFKIKWMFLPPTVSTDAGFHYYWPTLKYQNVLYDDTNIRFQEKLFNTIQIEGFESRCNIISPN